MYREPVGLWKRRGSRSQGQGDSFSQVNERIEVLQEDTMEKNTPGLERTLTKVLWASDSFGTLKQLFCPFLK